MPSVDRMAMVVDWFDAYRSSNLLSIAGLYHPDATLHCTCQGREIAIGGTDAIRAYWLNPFSSRPFLELVDIQQTETAVAVFYRTDVGVVRTLIYLNPEGQILWTDCSLQSGETDAGSCCS